jgi:methylenetetrahydrofolate/methylenetetrahydromethanopterin dehydrogenase (NADP+)
MPKSKILLQFDTDPQPSVFDAVVAIDAGAEHLLRHGNVTAEAVRVLIHGGMFTRGPADLHSTAVFIGGSNVAAAETILDATRRTFFGPLRMSVLLDAGGSNTTAAAAVLSAARHLSLPETTALVLGGTGPVGQRVVRLLAGAGAMVRVGSRNLERAESVRDGLAKRVGSDRLSAWATSDDEALRSALSGVQLVVAAGPPGAALLAAAARRGAANLKLAIDLNAVPPVGIEGLEPTDAACPRDGIIAYGALGIGGLKMKIHKAAIRRLFESNDAILEAEEVFALGDRLLDAAARIV